MKIEWKELKDKKVNELPAAEESRKKRIEQITDKVEKSIFRECRRQEAGTSVVYSIPRVGEFFSGYLRHLLGAEDWRFDEDIKEEVGQNILDRLISQGIDCKPVEGYHQVKIKLP